MRSVWSQITFVRQSLLVRCGSMQLSDVPDEDLRWVLGRLHYFLLKIIEDSDYDPAEDIENLDSIGLTD